MVEKMIKLPIADASDAQLFDYATKVLQLECGTGAGRDAIIATISLAWQNDWIMVEAGEHSVLFAQDDPVNVHAVKLAGSKGENDPRVELTIHQTEMPGGKDPVPVGVNGQTVVIQRNMRASVPYRYYVALQNANRMLVSQDLATGELSEIVVNNYPMTIHALPTPREIEEWKATTDEMLLP